MTSVSGIFASQVNGQALTTNPNSVKNECPADLYEMSNVLDIGDISEFEHVDMSANEKSEGIGSGIKNFVKDIFSNLFVS